MDRQGATITGRKIRGTVDHSHVASLRQANPDALISTRTPRQPLPRIRLPDKTPREMSRRVGPLSSRTPSRITHTFTEEDRYQPSHNCTASRSNAGGNCLRKSIGHLLAESCPHSKVSAESGPPQVRQARIPPADAETRTRHRYVVLARFFLHTRTAARTVIGTSSNSPIEKLYAGAPSRPEFRES